MAVHNELGAGFVEKVYQEALAVEMTARAIAFVREMGLSIHYRGERLPLEFRADFVCFDAIIVELKAIARLTPIETAQVLNYLKAARLSRALLITISARNVWNTEDWFSRRRTRPTRSDKPVRLPLICVHLRNLRFETLLAPPRLRAESREGTDRRARP